MTKTTPEEQINGAIEAFEEGWNRHDTAAAGGGFAEDADFVSVTGEWWRGRKEIVERLKGLHRGRFRGSELRISSVSIRFLGFDVAIVHLTWQLLGAGGPVRRGILTLTTSRPKGRWIFDAAQNTELID